MSLPTLSHPPATAPAGQGIRLRKARVADLPAINHVVEQAMATWKLSPRVLRLSLPLYRYTEIDLAHLELLIAERDDIVGVAALEMKTGDHAILLHGLYVDPQQRRQGIGSRLLQATEHIARLHQRGVRLRARPESIPFFEASGYRRLPQIDLGDEYPWLLWKSLAGQEITAA